MSKRVSKRTTTHEEEEPKYKYIESEDLHKIFRLENVLTFGLQDSRYAKELYPYTLPMSLRDYPDVREKLERIGRKHRIEKFIFRDTIYLKLKDISERQKEDLYEKGYKKVFITFSLSGICERVSDGKKYINFQVEVLRKVGDFGREIGAAPKDIEE